MPKLWNATVDAHRREVRDAILDTVGELIAEGGLLAVTMSRIAADTGIGRATLYRYFAGVEEVLHAWHERTVAAHLEHLATVRDQVDDPRERLTAVLAAYVAIRRDALRHGEEPHAGHLAAPLHGQDRLVHAEQRLIHLFEALLSDAADAGAVRGDVPADQLATYCRHALEAAIGSPSELLSRRLVDLTLAGLRAPPGTGERGGGPPVADPPR